MAKENLNSVKEIEIPINFYNYKLLKDKSFVLKGSHIYFVQGPNGVGKTTFLKALTSLQIADDDTVDKVSRGESEGSYEAVIPASDGTMVTIRHEFTDNNKGKFIAIREDGTKISKVTEIRSLFNYTPINVDQFFLMSNTAEGRRKQRDIILKLLPEEKQLEYNNADLQESHYYEKRTEVNRQYENTLNVLKSFNVSDEDTALLARKEEAVNLIKKYENIKTEKIKLTGHVMYIEQLNQRKEKLIAELKEVEEAISKKQNELDSISKTLPSITIEELDEKIEKGKAVINKITSIETNKLNVDKHLANKDVLKSEVDTYTEKIDHCRLTKQAIVSESQLPVENISFDDGYLTIDGFQFKENQICESDAVLILANILAKINPGPIQVIGDASILDYEKLEKLNKIAEDNNKIMFVDEVVRDANQIVVVGYEDIIDKSLFNALDDVDKPRKAKKEKVVDDFKSLDKIDKSVKPEIKNDESLF